MCLLLVMSASKQRKQGQGQGSRRIAVEVAEQWGSLSLGRRAVTPAPSTLEQGGHCELGDRGRGQTGRASQDM